MRECFSILFQCYDGKTYIEWRAADGQVRVGLLALMALVVDGGDYSWLTNNRGPKSLYGCARCTRPTSLFCSNVTNISQWNAMRRTYTQEVADITKAQAMPTQAERNHFTMVCGLHADTIFNPLYRCFGSLHRQDWVFARLLAFEPLHSIQSGVVMKTMQLMIQLPQVIHESPGVIALASSEAAVFADRVVVH